jgi:hypothetical protein
MVLFSVKLPQEMVDWFKSEATRTGRSTGDLLREMVAREQGGNRRRPRRSEASSYMKCPSCGKDLLLVIPAVSSETNPVESEAEVEKVDEEIA